MLNQRFLVGKKIFDRVLNGDDVFIEILIYPINHGSHRCAFTGSRCPTDEDDPVFRFRESDERIRLQVKLGKRRDKGLDVAHHHAHKSALMKAVYPKATPSAVLIREVNLAFLFPTTAEYLRHTLFDERTCFLKTNRCHFHRYETPVDAQITWFVGFNDYITRPTFHGKLE